MFNAPYQFRYCNKSTVFGRDCEEHILSFRCQFKKQYIVRVEQYDFSIYAIKFHLKAHRLSERKYSLLTNQNDVGRVIATCLEIMIYFYKRDPFASFCFIGMPSENESLNNTKRFRIYRGIMENYFSPVQFSHYEFSKESFYLILNKDNVETQLYEKVQRLYDEYIHGIQTDI